MITVSTALNSNGIHQRCKDVIFTARLRSRGKVIFSVVCVYLSVHEVGSHVKRKRLRLGPPQLGPAGKHAVGI